MAKKATQTVETFVEDAQKTAAASMEKMNKAAEDVSVLAQDNMDAVVKASETAAKAAEAMNAEVIAFAKKSVEEGVAAAKELSEIKTVPEFVERQSALLKGAFEGYVAQMTKLGEMSNAAIQDFYAPMTARAEASMDFAKNLRA